MTDELNVHERQFVLSFVVDSKRERYLSMLQSPKGRRRLLSALPHCQDLDMKYAGPIQPKEQSVESIERLLKQRGAPDVCHVISADPDVDNRDMSLHKALEETVGMNMGTFISCIPGKLGYFEFEDLGERYLLARK